MGNSSSSLSSLSSCSSESQKSLEIGVLKLEPIKYYEYEVYLNPNIFPTAKFVSINEDHEDIEECPKLYPIERNSGINEKAIKLHYDLVSKKLVEITPYAVNTPIETVIFNIDFAYLSDKTENAKKTLEINTDSMYDRIFNLIKDKEIFPKHKYCVNLPKSKSSDQTTLVLKSVVLLDADKNHLRIGKVNKGIKMLFRCSERLIHLTGSRIDTTRKQENKLCTKEEFMSIKKKIGGLDDVIDQIYSSLILTRLNQEKSEELGLKLNMGAIFVGPPGTGKSALASLIADSLNGKLTFVKGIKNNKMTEFKNVIIF